jgi:hypothetical protein
VLEACVRRYGLHKGAVRAADVGKWVIATQALGQVPTVEAYCEWWAVTERTGWRHAATCRELFGDEWRGVVLVLAAKAEDRLSVKRALSVGLPPSLGIA